VIAGAFHGPIGDAADGFTLHLTCPHSITLHQRQIRDAKKNHLRAIRQCACRAHPFGALAFRPPSSLLYSVLVARKGPGISQDDLGSPPMLAGTPASIVPLHHTR
jgi:hypothetical protein